MITIRDGQHEILDLFIKPHIFLRQKTKVMFCENAPVGPPDHGYPSVVVMKQGLLRPERSGLQQHLTQHDHTFFSKPEGEEDLVLRADLEVVVMLRLLNV
jgi:hypothetical protein